MRPRCGKSAGCGGEPAPGIGSSCSPSTATRSPISQVIMARRECCCVCKQSERQGASVARSEHRFGHIQRASLDEVLHDGI